MLLRILYFLILLNRCTSHLEILEIGISNIIQNPGNIGKRIFSIQSYPGNSGSYDPYISPILEILDRVIHIAVLSWKYWIVRSIY